MSCRFCVYWTGGQLDTPLVDLKVTGREADLARPRYCTLYPEWRKTDPHHYCGQMVLRPKDYWQYADEGHISQVDFYDRIWRDERAEEKSERTKRLELEKKLKATRAELRDLKAKANG